MSLTYMVMEPEDLTFEYSNEHSEGCCCEIYADGGIWLCDICSTITDPRDELEVDYRPQGGSPTPVPLRGA